MATRRMTRKELEQLGRQIRRECRKPKDETAATASYMDAQAECESENSMR